MSIGKEVRMRQHLALLEIRELVRDSLDKDFVFDWPLMSQKIYDWLQYGLGKQKEMPE